MKHKAVNNAIYINGMSSISAQDPEDIFSESPKSFEESIFPAIALEYKKFIKPMMLRRMSKAIKMGLVSAKETLKHSGVDMPDSIIVGTGEGCKQDTEKFLENLLDQDEALLTPTSFIQSTHNTVGGQIALDLKCTGYNMTYVQNSASFECALIDARLQFLEDKGTHSILVGGVDELAKTSTPFYYLDGQLKTEPINSLDLYKSNTEGTITSEGANFFLLSRLRTQQSIAEVVDCQLFNSEEKENIEEKIIDFLAHNGFKIEDLSAVMLGNNGDVNFDAYYENLQQNILQETPQLGFKHLCGDYNTATAFACWLGASILDKREVPEHLMLNDLKADRPQNMLIYNQYLGKNHSLILLRKL